MKSVKLMLEYKAWPLWIIDEDGFVADTKIPEEWGAQPELEKILDNLQFLYDSLFVDDGKEFAYKGFETQEEEEKFSEQVVQARQALLIAIPQGWIFEDKTIE